MGARSTKKQNQPPFPDCPLMNFESGSLNRSSLLVEERAKSPMIFPEATPLRELLLTRHAENLIAFLPS